MALGGRCLASSVADVLCRVYRGAALIKKFRYWLKKDSKTPVPGWLDGLHLSLSDLESDFQRIRSKKEKLFLRTFNNNVLYGMLEQVKLISHLERTGFRDIRLVVDTDENDIYYLKLYNKEIVPADLLFDLRLSETKFTPDPRFFPDGRNETYDMLHIEWLSARNPAQHFTSERPQLPGQNTPGLGILDHCFKFLQNIAKEVKKDGFLDIPDHIHGAIMYAKKFKFFDPAHEGTLRALMRDLDAYSLSDISWGIITQTIIEVYKNEPQPYDPSEQIFCLSRSLKNYFLSDNYRMVCNKYYKRKRFRFEYEVMLEKKKKFIDREDIDTF